MCHYWIIWEFPPWANTTGYCIIGRNKLFSSRHYTKNRLCGLLPISGRPNSEFRVYLDFI